MTDSGDDASVPLDGATRYSTFVSAPIETVMGVIADFGSYSEWTDSVQEAEVMSVGPDGQPSTVRFLLDAGPITDEYVLSYTWSDDGRVVEWELVSSTLQSHQSGRYELCPVEGGTEVTYELAIELTVPTIGRVRSRAERRIIGIAMSELRRRAESL